MASVGIAPTGMREAGGHNAGVDKLPEEMNDMKIRDDKVCNSINPSIIFASLLVLFCFFNIGY